MIALGEKKSSVRKICAIEIKGHRPKIKLLCDPPPLLKMPRTAVIMFGFFPPTRGLTPNNERKRVGGKEHKEKKEHKYNW